MLIEKEIKQMTFDISIVQVDKTTKPGAKYSNLEVAYKRLDTGKLEGKKLVSFSQPMVFKAISEAKSGDLFHVESEKNKDGYWDWVEVKALAPTSVSEATSPATKASGTVSPRSTYETPEERAQKQVYIVKQSSISNAIAILSHNFPKEKIYEDDLLKMAQKLTDFVFGKEKELDLFQQPNDTEVL